MTVDSPKGPEREARPICNCGPCQREAVERSAPIPYLRRRVAESIFDGLGIYNRPDADRAADLVVAMLRPKVDRLTFERDFAQANLEEYLQQLQDLRDDYLTGEPVPVTEVVSAAKRELERLTAEVDRLVQERDEVRKVLLPLLQRHALSKDDVQGDNLKAGYIAKIAADVLRWYGYEMQRWEATFGKDALPHATAIIEERDQLRAEVSRLREQLATAVVLPQDAEDQLRIAIADPGSRLPRIHYTPERASEPVTRWSGRSVLDLLASWAAPVSESVPATPQPCGQVHNGEVCTELRVHDTNGCWGHYGPRPQEMAQHNVVITKAAYGMASAYCFTCKQFASGFGQKAEDWRDQHLADTLRPVLTNESFISSLDEDAALFAVALDRVRRDKGERHTLEDVAEELELLDEGRPSGSERLAPRPAGPMALVREFHEAFGLPINDATRTLNKLRADLIREEGREAATALEAGPPEAWAKELADLVIVTYGAALTLGIDLDEAVRLVHASNMSKLGYDGKPVMRPDGKVLKGPNYEPPDMTSALLQDAAQAARSEATPEDPSPQRGRFKVGDEVRWCWTGANADGTWFKARLTEEHPARYPKGWAGEITDCGTAYTDEHMGEVPLGFKLFMDIPSLTLVSRPSPSLRKEGEDSEAR